MTTDKTTRVGAALLLLSPQGQFLMGRRTVPHGEGTWGPPGGHVDYGEDPLATAQRETREETGIYAEDVTLAGYSNDIFKDSGKHYVTFYFMARMPIGQQVKNLEPEKCAEWKWFYADELPENLFLPFANFVQKMGGTAGLRQLIAMAPRRAA